MFKQWVIFPQIVWINEWINEYKLNIHFVFHSFHRGQSDQIKHLLKGVAWRFLLDLNPQSLSLH